MINNILFYPGLFLSEEELTFFSVPWQAEGLPSRSEYFNQYELKLNNSLLKGFSDYLLNNLTEDELAFEVSQFCLQQTKKLNFNPILTEFKKDLRNTLLDEWEMPDHEISFLNLENSSILVPELMHHQFLHNALDEFYERIEIIKRGESLEAFYHKNNLLEHSDTLNSSSLIEFDYEYNRVLDVDFFELSGLFPEFVF
jgi:hypothetical protein